MVYLFLADGFEEIEALCTVDLLRRAKVEIKTVGVFDKIAKGSHNIPVVCDLEAKELDENSDFDMIILPGGLPGATNLDENETVDKIIATAFEKGKFIAAICAAPFMLGKRGILKGKSATCYPGFEKYFIDAKYENKGVIRDGNIITARAMGSAIDFSLELIEALCGKGKKEEIKKSIIY
jgi:4-methyl-5(b-hydroxyethyl)-thiazole monophosphate biosynthesis